MRISGRAEAVARAEQMVLEQIRSSRSREEFLEQADNLISSLFKGKP